MFLFRVSHVIPPPGNPGHPAFCVNWPGQPHRQHTLELPPQQSQHCQPRCSSSATAQQSVFQRPWGAGLHVLQQLRQPRPSAHQRGHCSWGNIYEYLRFFQFESSVSSCCTKPTAKESWVGATHTWHGLKSSQQTGRHSLQLRPPNKRLNLTLLRAHICSQSKSEDLNLIRHPLSHLWPARDHPQPRGILPMTRPAIEAAALPASQKQRRSIWGGLQVISMRRVWRYRGYQFFESISVQYALKMSLSTRKGSEFESWTSSNIYYSSPPWLLREYHRLPSNPLLWTQTSMKMPWDFSTALAAEVPRLGSQGGIGWLVVNVEYGWISLKAPFWVPLVIKCLWYCWLVQASKTWSFKNSLYILECWGMLWKSFCSRKGFLSPGVTCDRGNGSCVAQSHSKHSILADSTRSPERRGRTPRAWKKLLKLIWSCQSIAA